MSAWPADPHEQDRERMVEEQLVSRGIRDPKVLEAMRRLPRHLFVPEENRPQSYEDRPLSIGAGQTVSQPYVTALMTEHLRVAAGAKLLEVGTGSGYQAAVLARMGARLYTIERIPELASAARRRLEELGITAVRIKVGDGSLGWPEEAPFDGIMVTAYVPEAPQPLLEQLAEGGRMVVPVGQSMGQRLICVERKPGRFQETVLCDCLFVPLLGAGGDWRRW